MSDRISAKRLAGIIREEKITVRTAVILGSGLSIRYGGRSRAWPVAYDDIEGMAGPLVDGHAGRLFPTENGLLVFSGRSHVYESGESLFQEAPVRLASALGCRNILITQAAGSLVPSLPPGSWMSASDIISFPYRGSRRYSSGSAAETKDGGCPDAETKEGCRSALKGRAAGGALLSMGMRTAVEAAARAAGVPVRSGVLFWTPGPNYETRAESMMMASAGADAVTMSPLPELAEARRCGMRAASLSWITNYTANVEAGGTGHQEVIEMGRRGSRMLSSILERLSGTAP